MWVRGARPKTLGAAISPVLVGTAVAGHYGPVSTWPALGALVVAVALQVGVNFSNDYSDGVRGVDVERKGPVRLTASGLAAPQAVKAGAIASFGMAAVVGLMLAVAVDLRLVLVGVAAIAAAGLYSGGPKPYASEGLGEVSVLVFFGFVATCGSAYVQLHRVPLLAVGGSLAVGLLACAILLVNNLRDLDSDAAAGKRTLAVRVGRARARQLYEACIVVGLATAVALGAIVPGALLTLLAAPLAASPLHVVAQRSDPPALVTALVATVRLQLALSALLALGLWLWPR